MRTEPAKPDCESKGEPTRSVAAGVPDWITPELIRLTLKVWQPYYSEQLTTEDAVTIVRNAGQLFGVLARE